MQKVVQEQEDKIIKLFHNKNKDKYQTVLNFKRKASECTDAPNSPLRKTKTVRKEKS